MLKDMKFYFEIKMSVGYGYSLVKKHCTTYLIQKIIICCCCFTDLKVQDSGKYTCKAVSAAGETIWDAFLMVTSKLPLICTFI